MTEEPVLDDEGQAALYRLRQQAADAPFDVRKILETIQTKAGLRKHLERMKDFTIRLPPALIVTYSIETGHPSPGAETCRHLSISSWRKGEELTEDVLWEIAVELGFIGDLTDCSSWKEDLGGSSWAFNIVQPLYENHHQAEGRA